MPSVCFKPALETITLLVVTDLKETKGYIVQKLIMRKLNFLFVIIISVLLFLSSCKNDVVITPEQTVETTLNEFVSTLVSIPPTSADVSNRVKQYLQTKGYPTNYFYGSTVTLLDSLGVATYSPYWYRNIDTLMMIDLAADTSYHINTQAWLRQAIDSRTAIWTAPYFDAGGGNIWMKTRSVPVVVNGKIIAVATTDLPTTP